jgi:hypothetical protein
MRKCKMFVLVLLFGCMSPSLYSAVTLDFEGRPDLELITNQYSSFGVTFGEAIILTAGYSLNEIDFPPYSGIQVLGDDLGPLTASFTNGATYVGGYFTYSEELNLFAYDEADVFLGSVQSLSNSNFGSNEFISFSSLDPISRIVIQGNLDGASFTLDDFTFEPLSPPSTVPVPGSALLGLLGMTMVSRMRNIKQ